MAKSLALTIILAVVIAGVEQIYLGYKKHDIIILIARVAIWLGVALFVPFPFSLVFGVILGGGFWVWQLIDAVRLFNKMRSGVDGQISIKKS